MVSSMPRTYGLIEAYKLHPKRPSPLAYTNANMPEDLIHSVSEIVSNVERFLLRFDPSNLLPEKWNELKEISVQLGNLVGKLRTFNQLLSAGEGEKSGLSNVKIEANPSSFDSDEAVFVLDGAAVGHSGHILQSDAIRGRSLDEETVAPVEKRSKDRSIDAHSFRRSLVSAALDDGDSVAKGEMRGEARGGKQEEEEEEEEEEELAADCLGASGLPGERLTPEDDRRLRVESSYSSSSSSPVPCLYCDESFASKKLCLAHFRSRHVIGKGGGGGGGGETELWYRCLICESTFNRKRALREHFRLTHDQRTFLCNLCGLEVKLQRELKEHMTASHGQGRKHVCDVCQKEFHRRNTLRLHQSSVHENHRFSCQFCDKDFSQKIQWRRHVRFFHENDPSCGHTCHFCGQRFLEKQNLLKHLSKHEESGMAEKRDFRCGDCDKKFRSKRELILHARKIHDPDRKRNVQCNACAAMFFTEHLCLAHQRRVHEQRRDFPCKFCPKKFQSAQHAKLHERTHTGERPFVCDFQGCGKSFGDSSNLKKHQVIHTGIRPYNCHVCKSGFMRKKQLQDHQQSNRCDLVNSSL